MIVWHVFRLLLAAVLIVALSPLLLILLGLYLAIGRLGDDGPWT